MEVNKIYFDLDDTLAEFSKGLYDICGLDPVPQDCATPEQDDAMWAAIRDSNHFYYHLEEHTPGIKLFNKLRAQYGDKVEILSAVPKEKRGIVHAEEDKRNWVKEHLGKDVVTNITYTSKDKKQYCKGPGHFLIDDLGKNISSWQEAGGVGIQYNKDDPSSACEELSRISLLDQTKLQEGE